MRRIHHSQSQSSDASQFKTKRRINPSRKLSGHSAGPATAQGHGHPGRPSDLSNLSDLSDPALGSNAHARLPDEIRGAQNGTTNPLRPGKTKRLPRNLPLLFQRSRLPERLVMQIPLAPGPDPLKGAELDLFSVVIRSREITINRPMPQCPE